MRYRLAPSAKVSSELSATHHAAFELLGNVNGAALTPDDARKLVKTRDDLMTFAAGAYVAKPPAEVLETLKWVQEMAQARATENDFNSAREALAEHESLAFVTDWLESQGVDVTVIRGAELAPAVLTTIKVAADAEYSAEQTALAALESASEDASDVMGRLNLSSADWDSMTPAAQAALISALA
jgi:hypothetical protein